jgi:branched-chain amino acid transport system permease protein
LTPARALLFAFAAAMAAAPLFLPEFYVTLLNYIGLYSVVTLGLVLLTGAAGLISLGHAAFVGFGAYTTAVLTTTYGLSPWIGLPFAIAVTGAAALVIGALTLRLSGHYLVLGTIAWGISLYFVFGNVEGLGGYNGIAGIPALSLFGFAFESAQAHAYLIWGVVFLVLLSISNLLNSRTGRAVRTLRNAGLAEAYGIATTRLKTYLFVYSAVLAGIAGWLHAHYLRFINPGPFGVNASIEYLFMIVVGGFAHVWGAIAGAAVFTVIKTWLQDLLPRLTGSSGQFDIIVFGILIIVLLQTASSGLMPALSRLMPRRTPISVPAAAEPLPRRSKAVNAEQLLEVDRVRKRFGGLVAVDDVSFSIRAGEILGLIGPNGAGKTTLFNLITGALPLDSGAIRFRGRRLDELPAHEIVRHGIARTFQHAQLRPAMTVVENVALGAHSRGSKGLIAAALHAERDEERRLLFEAARQLRRVGLGDHLYALAGSLPLGRQRIVEIARALAADPILLLLDEPAAGLRYQEKQALAGLIGGLRAEGMAVLLVEHDMEFVMGLVDRLVVMDFGQTIALGTPAEVQHDARVVAAYLGA